MENKTTLDVKTSYKVAGYKNRWGVIDAHAGYVLLENETWGDETCYLVARQDVTVALHEYTRKDGIKVVLPTITEIVCETYDDIDTALRDEGLI